MQPSERMRYVDTIDALFVILLAMGASVLCGYYLVAGLRSGRVAAFHQMPPGKISRKQSPGWFWATLALWCVGMLVSAYVAVTWMRDIVSS